MGFPVTTGGMPNGPKYREQIPSLDWDIHNTQLGLRRSPLAPIPKHITPFKERISSPKAVNVSFRRGDISSTSPPGPYPIYEDPSSSSSSTSFSSAASSTYSEAIPSQSSYRTNKPSKDDKEYLAARKREIDAKREAARIRERAQVKAEADANVLATMVKDSRIWGGDLKFSMLDFYAEESRRKKAEAGVRNEMMKREKEEKKEKRDVEALKLKKERESAREPARASEMKHWRERSKKEKSGKEPVSVKRWFSDYEVEEVRDDISATATTGSGGSTRGEQSRAQERQFVFPSRIKKKGMDEGLVNPYQQQQIHSPWSLSPFPATRSSSGNTLWPQQVRLGNWVWGSSGPQTDTTTLEKRRKKKQGKTVEEAWEARQWHRTRDQKGFESSENMWHTCRGWEAANTGFWNQEGTDGFSRRKSRV